MLAKFTLVLLLLPAWLLGRPPAAAAQADPTAEIIAQVNQIRAAYGVGPMQYNAQLAAAAQNQVNWMASTGLYSHTQSNGSTPLSRAQAAGYNAGYVGENIVGGTQLTPRQGVIWWQNSPVHLANMTNARWIDVGIGFAVGQGQNMYVMVMGLPANAPGGAGTFRPPVNAAPIVVTPIELATPNPDGSIVHVVQPGQTAWALAARYEVDLVQLLQINNLKEGDFLHPGDEVMVRLPEGYATPTPPAAHVVQKGQSLWSIAALYQISLADLLAYNSLKPDDFIQPGQELVVRPPAGWTPPPTPTPPTTHLVASGESLWTIAASYGLTLEQLLSYNKLDASALLRPGLELLIAPPTATATATPASTPTPAPTLPPAEGAPSPTPPPPQAGGRSPEAATPALPTPPPVPAATPLPGGNAVSNGSLSLVLAGLALLTGLALLLRGR